MVHVCWYSFYRPREDGKLSELYREKRLPKYSTLDQAGGRTGYSGLGGRDFTTAPTPIKRVLAVFFIENSAFYINNNNNKKEEEDEEEL